MQKLKILHCPTTVGGNPQGLSRAERKLDYNSRSLTLLQNYLNYPADEVIFKKAGFSFFNELRRWKAIFKSIRHYDVLHYNFGQTLAPSRPYPKPRRVRQWIIQAYNFLYGARFEMADMKMAHSMKKVIAMTYQGDDARQGDYCRKNYAIHFAHTVGHIYYNDQSDALKREHIRIVDHYADLIYAVNPDLLNVLPSRAKFIPYASVHIQEWPTIGITNIDELHIVHAPTNRAVKGTDYILKVFYQLKQEGISFRYTLVENVSHAEARKIYETADILIDQLLAGFYGALSVEFMAMAKPVICYIREEDLHHLPQRMREQIPIINANPHNLYHVLKEVLTKKQHELSSIGKASRAYVEEWHDPIKIARMVTSDYERVYAQKHSMDMKSCAV